jgi:diketogulonate reductase-like aldo/keto reductase
MKDSTWLTSPAGIQMPRILYGTAWKKERTAELVAQALEAGFRGFDTACQPKHYDERLVGVGLSHSKALEIPRNELYLQTKYTPLSSQDPNKLPYDAKAPVASQVAQSFEVSQSNLQTDYVDCLILHSPMVPHETMMQAWQAMEAIHAGGGARQLGISNCYDPAVFKTLYADATVKPAVLQNRFYKDNGYDAEQRLWCAGQGVVFESFWSLTANAKLLVSPLVQDLAQAHERTEVQVFFRYLSQLGIVPLTGTSSEQHMREDLGIFDFELTAEQMNQMDTLLTQACLEPDKETKA